MADGRGRIQLPVKMRVHKLYELVQENEKISLYPLQTQRLGKRQEAVESVWLNEEVFSFLKKQVFPKMAALAEKEFSDICGAIILYGSRARRDAMTASDFDFAFLTSKKLSFLERSQIWDVFEESLQLEIQTLKEHSVYGDVSFIFIPYEFIPTQIPALYMGIIEDGIVAWEKNQIAKRWMNRVQSTMKKMGAKWKGTNRKRVWIWEK